MNYTLTNESATLVVDGKAKTFKKGDVNYEAVRAAILDEDWDSIDGILAGGGLGRWLNKPRWSAEGLTIKYDGRAIPENLGSRIRRAAAEGGDPSGFINFWERLSRNPSKRSVDQLFEFLKHQDINIEPDGTFLAYKGVRDDLKDAHSGTIDNSPGQIVKMARNEISDDPREACHAGLHVGALQYAATFASKTIIVRVDPENVVCVPYDHSAQKMRVCQYEVVGYHVTDEAEAPMPEHGEVDDTKGETVTCRECGGSGMVEYDEYEEAECGECGGTGEVDVEPESEYDQTVGPIVKEISKKAAPRRSWGRLDARGLMKVPVTELRTYASKVLKIVGASKLAGGKRALVKRILRVRKKK